MDPIVDDFLIVDIDPPEPLSTPDTIPISRTETRLSIRSISSNIFLPTTGAIELSLSEFCAYVDERRSLQRATIVAVEGYHQTIGIVKHRFALLEISRKAQKNIWLRLDRRRGKGVSVLRFVAARGKTMANDVVGAKQGVSLAEKPRLTL
ncbi:hypothetical protein DL93DRAFT_577634 [Clavulina sp. PMI_390]|nr:hypothetical protein DL93DRAFT_577634 [Clavulina sp. PMI_390]